MNATLHTSEGHPVLRFERRLAHPVAKVWRAITEPSEMAHWFPAAVRTELAVGAAMRFGFGDDNMDPGGEFTEGEILEFEPPKVYAFRWNDSVLRFELVPNGAGCLLIFTHTLSGVPTTGDFPSAARQAPGWDGCLLMLEARLADTPPPELGQAWFLRHAEHYVEAFGLGEGTVSRTDDGWLLRFERDLVPAPDVVWRTLTEDDEPVIGQPPPVRLTHPNLTPGAVTELRAPHVVAFDWLHEDRPKGTVRFSLADQKPVGCRLVVTQTVPDGLRSQRALALASWHTHLELFFAALYGDIRCPWPADRTEQLRQDYAQRLDGVG